jgi:hypothetical protein
MEVSGQLQAPAILLPGKELLHLKNEYYKEGERFI